MTPTLESGKNFSQSGTLRGALTTIFKPEATDNRSIIRILPDSALTQPWALGSLGPKSGSPRGAPAAARSREGCPPGLLL